MNFDTYRIIFLDIDGVLNHRDYFRRMPREQQEDIEDIDPDCVACLQRLVNATGARIVISSTWRLLHELDEIRDVLSRKGLDAKIIAATPALPDKDRGDEIQKWLDMASVFPRKPEGIVILDDDADMGPLLPWLIQTSFDRGLTDWHVRKAVEMLNRPRPPVFVDAPMPSNSPAKEESNGE